MHALTPRALRSRFAVAFALAILLAATPSYADQARTDDTGIAPPALGSVATAGDHAASDATDASSTRELRQDVPLVAYTYSAAGAPAKTFGAALYGTGLTAAHQPGIIGGGLTLWGSPIDRLTIIGDGSRNVFGDFAPSLGATVRLYGKPGKGLNIGALGRYKIDGFGRGPTKDEVEGELEAGFLIGYHVNGYHADANVITGFGTGDDGEIDVEGRLRLSRDLGRYARLGIDGQTRIRLGGPLVLSNGRSWDWVLGPQFFVGHEHFFGAFTAGPTTTGTTTKNVGAVAILSVGGTTF